ncbi:tetratricopeptide repeat protein [Rhodocytophaga rosea]|uniref:Tetratricopeptide repeat protein n=1 Tax=Rhodocytophaga rosea TaxID=2704465 RepID=A0A6C0GDX3_9BACT|nr:tetratricopeptide repeat protein [Rhodocytophaga rosea]QHT66138.1 tetratricopeptide repeat protein [Rhodocytophaga rosea]
MTKLVSGCILCLILFNGFTAFSQQKEAWIMQPKEKWKPIALINEVWYQNGERYVHSSFEYAATGFLIDTGTDTLAVTAKHVLWIAKTKAMNRVDMGNSLQKWLMHPKNNLADSVVIDRLLNADTSEVLQGPASTITQRDWLVFSTSYHSPAIQPLKPRYSKVNPGEKIYIFASPYEEKSSITIETRVIEAMGTRIIIDIDSTFKVGGASGSPIVDENGYLIGILGGSSVSRKTGKPAIYAISTHYLQKALDQDKNLNTPLISAQELLLPIILSKGMKAAVKEYRRHYASHESRLKYDLESPSLNKLGQHLLLLNHPKDAIEAFQLSIADFPWYFETYNLLGNAYVAAGNSIKAIKAYQQSVKLYPEDKTAQEAINTLSAK